MDIKELAQRFHALFAGLERAHGTYEKPTIEREDGKLKGAAYTIQKPVNDALWERHLSGQHGLGVIPIRDDSTCMFGAIDLDVYADFDHAAMAKRIQELQFPLIPCRSKSGGCHLYVFCAQPVDAGKLRDTLRDIMAKLGHSGSEIFPSHDKMSTSGDLSYWINAPYFDAANTTRYAIRPDGDAMTAEEFLAAADAAKVGPDFFNGKAPTAKEAAKKKNDLLPDGPPCLQHLMELGFPVGTWNSGVYNLGIYCRKAYPSDWRERLVQLNAVNFPVDKWPASDLNPVINSLAKKVTNYGCSKHPLVNYCDQIKCRTRKYGVGGGASGFPVLGGLRKLLTVPPAWFWDVQDSEGNTHTLELSTEDLQNPDAFQRKCMERINTMPMMPTRVVWAQTVQNALKTVQEMEAPPADASTEGQFWELLEQFCTGRAQADTKDGILLGKTWTDDGRTYFRTQDLLKYLARVQFKEYKVQQVAKVLKMRKDPDTGVEVCKHEFVNLGGRGVNLWSVPAFAKRVESFDLPKTTDERF